MADQTHTPSQQSYATGDACVADAPAKGKWEAELFGCFNDCVPNGLMSWCCPCISISQIAARLGVMSFWKALSISCSMIVTFFILWVVSSAIASSGGSSSVTYDYKYNSNGAPSGVEGSGDSNVNDNDFQFTTQEVSVEASGPNTTAILILQVFTLITGLAYLLCIWYFRNKTRERFEIPGSYLNDCCASYWCSCCVIAQMATHVKSYKPGSCDFGPVDTLPGYA